MIDISNPGADRAALSSALSNIIGSNTKTVGVATYTLTDADHGFLLDVTVECTITVPTDLRTDFSCGWLQRSVDQITFIADAGATIVEPDAFDKSEKQWATGGLTAIGSDTFVLYGRLAA